MSISFLDERHFNIVILHPFSHGARAHSQFRGERPEVEAAQLFDEIASHSLYAIFV